MLKKLFFLPVGLMLLFTSCSKNEEENIGPLDPDTAPEAEIDRFSDDAGVLFTRSANADLPGANQPINFDEKPFVTKAMGPNGDKVSYYNFDVKTVEPAPIYFLFKEGESTAVEGQLSIVNLKPGDIGYNDFRQVYKVTVPTDYEANTIASLSEIESNNYEVQATDQLINMPIVPNNSTAGLRWNDGESSELKRAWYRSQVVYFFQFDERAINFTSRDEIPLSPLYVSYKTNPGEEGGGNGSGFMTEQGNDQTHNILAALPMDSNYSPLWSVTIYDNNEFESVTDYNSAQTANIIEAGNGPINAPVVQSE